MAKENKQPEQNEALRGILDPIAPEDLTEHWQNISGWLDPMRDLNPEYLANMDYNKQISGGNQSFNQYWDDSSPEMQWTLGWTNQKYTWEYTKNSDINYDANITTKDLNPNFVYWKASQVYGTDHPWYISQRNDQIASALFNEWRVSKDEVRQFLEGQNWFWNSSEADRANTVESIWKRLWQLSEQNKPEEEWPDLSKAEEIQKDTSGKIYWKTTAEEWTPKEWIDTLADKNSVYAAMEAWRVANLKALVSMNPKDIAIAELSWISPQWEQANRDLQQYYPDIYKQVQEEKKKIIAQENVNTISSGGSDLTTVADSWQSNISNSITDFASNNETSTTSASEISKSVTSTLEWNQTANSASETMASIESEMANLKNRLKNLRQEANSAFKWDVPDYLVNAYINNKTQDIQNQMSILEDRYNAAYSRYKTELANAQWEKEYDLKKQQLELQQKAAELNEWATKQWIEIDWYKAKWGWTSVSNSWRELPVTEKTRDEIWSIVDTLVEKAKNWQLWNAQCAAWIQKYYFTELWISIGWLSSFDAKKWLINTNEYYVPKKWDLIIMSSPTSPANWHIWIVVGVDGDKITYLDWNGSVKDGVWTETAAVRTKSINDSNIAWYYDVTKWQQSSWGYTFSEQDVDALENYLLHSNEMSKTEVEALAASFGVDVAWLRQLANEVVNNKDKYLWWSSNGWSSSDDWWYTWDATTYDIDSMDIPDSVYIVEDDEKHMSRKVDPNSEEWKQLAQKYIQQKMWTNWWTPQVWTQNYSTSDWVNIWWTSYTWFSPDLTDLYIWLNDGSIKMTDAVDRTGKTQSQLRKELNAYNTAVKNGYSDDKSRGVDEKLWYNPEKWEAYGVLIAANYSLPKTKWEATLKSLWLNPKDDNSYSKAIEEAKKYAASQRNNETALEMIDALEYIMMQASNRLQRNAANNWVWGLWGVSNMFSWEANSWKSSYRYLKDNLTLNHLVELKQNWATFGALSNQELDAIGAAASRLDASMWEDEFRKEINKMYNKMRKNAWYSELTQAQLDSMWDAEKHQDFTNYISRNSSNGSWIFGWWTRPRKKSSWWNWWGWYNIDGTDVDSALDEIIGW